MYEAPTRRQALAAFGSVSLGGLLAACGGDFESSSSSVGSSEATATVEAKTTTSRATSELFDGSATCRVSAELIEGPFYFASIRSGRTSARTARAPSSPCDPCA